MYNRHLQAAVDADTKIKSSLQGQRIAWMASYLFESLMVDEITEILQTVAEESIFEGRNAKNAAERESGIVFPDPVWMQFGAYDSLAKIWKTRKEKLRENIANNFSGRSEEGGMAKKSTGGLSAIQNARLQADRRKRRAERRRQKQLCDEMEIEDNICRVFYQFELKENLRERRFMRAEDLLSKDLREAFMRMQAASHSAYLVVGRGVGGGGGGSPHKNPNPNPKSPVGKTKMGGATKGGGAATVVGHPTSAHETPATVEELVPTGAIPVKEEPLDTQLTEVLKSTPITGSAISSNEVENKIIDIPSAENEIHGVLNLNEKIDLTLTNNENKTSSSNGTENQLLSENTKDPVTLKSKNENEENASNLFQNEPSQNQNEPFKPEKEPISSSPTIILEGGGDVASDELPDRIEDYYVENEEEDNTMKGNLIGAFQSMEEMNEALATMSYERRRVALKEIGLERKKREIDRATMIIEDYRSKILQEDGIMQRVLNRRKAELDDADSDEEQEQKIMQKMKKKKSHSNENDENEERTDK